MRELAHMSRHTETAKNNPKEAKGLPSPSPLISSGLFLPWEAGRQNKPLSLEFPHSGAPKWSL